MERFLDYVLRHIIEYPAEMVILKEEAPKKVVFKLQLAKSDVGRVVGKGGSTIQALRNLLAAAGSKRDEKISLEIAEEPQ
jgi:predicted RNA-binding protein YlqC (UPF0109 family)